MKRIKRKCKSSGNLGCYFFICLLVSIVLYLFDGDFYFGIFVVVVSSQLYPLIVTFFATILLTRGYITEKSYVVIILKGFKIVDMLKNLVASSVTGKLHKSPRENKFQ